MERLIAAVAPRWALKRALARLAIERLYKAATPSHARVAPTDFRSGDGVMDHARAKLRQWGRHLDENHDLTHSILNTLSYQASQITLEPRVRGRGGAPAERVNDALKAMWLRERDRIEASGTMPWCEFASTAARTWLRDGEVFVQHMLGTLTRYPGRLQYLIQAHEPDLVPFDLVTEVPNIVHGIEVDRFGRPRAYHLYKRHPGDSVRGATVTTETIRIPAEQITHVRLAKRLGQKRGASVLAPAVTRLSDVADYEESERLAAKVASSLCAAITRGADFVNTSTAVDASSGERPMELQAGMIIDGLMPGERIEVLDTKRPNTALPDFRRAMLRAATAGIGVSYSTATHDYDGTYSSQRQELVEVQQSYSMLRAHFVAAFYRPIWERFVRAAVLAGVVTRGADLETLGDFEAVAPPAPWIDPQKEASADEIAIRSGIESRHGVIRKRGGDPQRVDDERERDRDGAPAAPEPAREDEEPEEANALEANA